MGVVLLSLSLVATVVAYKSGMFDGSKNANGLMNVNETREDTLNENTLEENHLQSDSFTPDDVTILPDSEP